MAASPLSAIIPLLLVVGVLAALWVGVVGLARSGRTGSWWCMLSGLTSLSLGLILYAMTLGVFVSAYSGSSSGSSRSLGSAITMLLTSAGAIGLGVLAFAIGFAIHGQRAAAAASRQLELEQLTAAMSEELDQLRKAPGSHE